MTVVLSPWELRALAMRDYPAWAGQLEFGPGETHRREEWKNGRRHHYMEYSAFVRNPGLDDSRTIVARTPNGFANRLDRLLASWDRHWRVSSGAGGAAIVRPGQRGTNRGTIYVQVVYLDDERDASEVDVTESVKHNGLRKPHRGEKSLQHSYLYRWPFEHMPTRGDLVIATGTLAFVTRLSKPGSNWNGYTVDLDAFVGGDARTMAREQLIGLVKRYPRRSEDAGQW